MKKLSYKKKRGGMRKGNQKHLPKVSETCTLHLKFFGVWQCFACVCADYHCMSWGGHCNSWLIARVV